MTGCLTSRERILKALNHEESDRVPLDLGGTNVTTITAAAYRKLRRHLGLPEEERLRVLDQAQQIVAPAEDMLQRLEVDTRSVWPLAPLREVGLEAEEEIIDGWGVRRRKVAGSWHYDAVGHPLAGAEEGDLERFAGPGLGSPALLEEAFKAAPAEYALVVDPTGSIPFQNAQLMRGFDTFLVDLLTNRRFAERLMGKLLDYQIGKLQAFFRAAKAAIGIERIDVVKMADDLGSQSAPLISPQLYRESIKPFHAELARFIRENSPAKVFFHSDGAVVPFLEDLVEIGVDILNPVQVSAAGMDSRTLKRDFGDHLSFWGGIDTQAVLPRGTPQEVEREVRARIDDLAPGGGYVLAAVHNLQPDVPPENITAMFRAARERGGIYAA